MIARLLIVAAILMAWAAIDVAVAQDCNYIVGDTNGDGRYTGLDVVFSVHFFRGGPHPLYTCECPAGSGYSWYVAGDVNGSCTFSGQDVSFMVRNFRGDPWGRITCPDCPGSYTWLPGDKSSNPAQPK